MEQQKKEKRPQQPLSPRMPRLLRHHRPLCQMPHNKTMDSSTPTPTIQPRRRLPQMDSHASSHRRPTRDHSYRYLHSLPGNQPLQTQPTSTRHSHFYNPATRHGIHESNAPRGIARSPQIQIHNNATKVILQEENTQPGPRLDRPCNENPPQCHHTNRQIFPHHPHPCPTTPTHLIYSPDSIFHWSTHFPHPPTSHLLARFASLGRWPCPGRPGRLGNSRPCGRPAAFGHPSHIGLCDSSASTLSRQCPVAASAYYSLPQLVQST